MSTKSDISILQPDGTVQTQYIHMDGYPAGVGEVLIRTYPKKEWADDIMKIGHYDSTLPQTRAELKEHISDPKNEITSQKFNSLEEAINHFSETKTTPQAGQTTDILSSWQEYHYLMAPNRIGEYTWNVVKPSGIEKLDTEVTTTFDADGALVPNQEFAHSANWANRLITPDQKQDEKQANYLAPLTKEEKEGLSASIMQFKKNLETYVEGKSLQKDQDTKKQHKSTSNKFDRNSWKKQHEKTVDDLKKGLLKEVEHYTETPEQVLELLRFTDKFHQYSTRNTMMIHMQRPSSVAVGSFAKFKSMGYHVNKGEKGIKMFVPTEATFFYRDKKDGNKDRQEPTQLKNATKEERDKIKSGEIQTASKTFYKIGTVFDVTQTDMPKEKYPELYPNRHRDFDMKDPSQLNFLEKGLKQVAQNMNMPVITYDHSMTNIPDPQNAKGYFDRNTNQIVLNQYNTPTENITVLAHELGHAQLHNNKKQEKDLPRELKEMQAELTSYLYSFHYGIDTKDETVQYIADWTENGKKFNELAPDVKGKILTHVGSATKTLTKATDRVIEQERIDKVAEETFLKNPETSKWYEQRQAMEKESTQREQGQSVGHLELDKLHKLESKMTPHEIQKLDSKFVETQSWNSDGVKSLVSKDVEDKIKQNAKKETSQNVEKAKTTTVSTSEDLTNSSKKEDKSKLKEQYQQYLSQQGLQR